MSTEKSDFSKFVEKTKLNNLDPANKEHLNTVSKSQFHTLEDNIFVGNTENIFSATGVIGKEQAPLTTPTSMEPARQNLTSISPLKTDTADMGQYFNDYANQIIAPAVGVEPGSLAVMDFEKLEPEIKRFEQSTTLPGQMPAGEKIRLNSQINEVFSKATEKWKGFSTPILPEDSPTEIKVISRINAMTNYLGSQDVLEGDADLTEDGLNDILTLVNATPTLPEEYHEPIRNFFDAWKKAYETPASSIYPSTNMLQSVLSNAWQGISSTWSAYKKFESYADPLVPYLTKFSAPHILLGLNYRQNNDGRAPETMADLRGALLDGVLKEEYIRKGTRQIDPGAIFFGEQAFGAATQEQTALGDFVSKTLGAEAKIYNPLGIAMKGVNWLGPGGMSEMTSPLSIGINVATAGLGTAGNVAKLIASKSKLIRVLGRIIQPVIRGQGFGARVGTEFGLEAGFLIPAGGLEQNKEHLPEWATGTGGKIVAGFGGAITVAGLIGAINQIKLVARNAERTGLGGLRTPEQTFWVMQEQNAKDMKFPSQQLKLFELPLISEGDKIGRNTIATIENALPSKQRWTSRMRPSIVHESMVKRLVNGKFLKSSKETLALYETYIKGITGEVPDLSFAERAKFHLFASDLGTSVINVRTTDDFVRGMKVAFDLPDTLNKVSTDKMLKNYADILSKHILRIVPEMSNRPDEAISLLYREFRRPRAWVSQWGMPRWRDIQLLGDDPDTMAQVVKMEHKPREAFAKRPRTRDEEINEVLRKKGLLLSHVVSLNTKKGQGEYAALDTMFHETAHVYHQLLEMVMEPEDVIKMNSEITDWFINQGSKKFIDEMALGEPLTVAQRRVGYSGEAFATLMARAATRPQDVIDINDPAQRELIRGGLEFFEDMTKMVTVDGTPLRGQEVFGGYVDDFLPIPESGKSVAREWLSGQMTAHFDGSPKFKFLDPSITGELPTVQRLKNITPTSQRTVWDALGNSLAIYFGQLENIVKNGDLTARYTFEEILERTGFPMVENLGVTKDFKEFMNLLIEKQDLLLTEKFGDAGIEGGRKVTQQIVDLMNGVPNNTDELIAARQTIERKSAAVNDGKNIILGIIRSMGARYYDHFVSQGKRGYWDRYIGMDMPGNRYDDSVDLMSRPVRDNVEAQTARDLFNENLSFDNVSLPADMDKSGWFSFEKLIKRIPALNEVIPDVTKLPENVAMEHRTFEQAGTIDSLRLSIDRDSYNFEKLRDAYIHLDDIERGTLTRIGDAYAKDDKGLIRTGGLASEWRDFISANGGMSPDDVLGLIRNVINTGDIGDLYNKVVVSHAVKPDGSPTLFWDTAWFDQHLGWRAFSEASSDFEQRYVELAQKTARAEKTPGRRMAPEETALMQQDWKAYSRSRGYTKKEIADQEAFIEMTAEGERLGYTLGDLHGMIIEPTALRNRFRDTELEDAWVFVGTTEEARSIDPRQSKLSMINGTVWMTETPMHAALYTDNVRLAKQRMGDVVNMQSKVRIHTGKLLIPKGGLLNLDVSISELLDPLGVSRNSWKFRSYDHIDTLRNFYAESVEDLRRFTSNIENTGFDLKQYFSRSYNNFAPEGEFGFALRDTPDIRAYKQSKRIDPNELTGWDYMRFFASLGNDGYYNAPRDANVMSLFDKMEDFSMRSLRGDGRLMDTDIAFLNNLTNEHGITSLGELHNLFLGNFGFINGTSRVGSGLYQGKLVTTARPTSVAGVFDTVKMLGDIVNAGKKDGTLLDRPVHPLSPFQSNMAGKELERLHDAINGAEINSVATRQLPSEMQSTSGKVFKPKAKHFSAGVGNQIGVYTDVSRDFSDRISKYMYDRLTEKGIYGYTHIAGNIGTVIQGPTYAPTRNFAILYDPYDAKASFDRVFIRPRKSVAIVSPNKQEFLPGYVRGKRYVEGIEDTEGNVRNIWVQGKKHNPNADPWKGKKPDEPGEISSEDLQGLTAPTNEATQLSFKIEGLKKAAKALNAIPDKSPASASQSFIKHGPFGDIPEGKSQVRIGTQIEVVDRSVAEILEKPGAIGPDGLPTRTATTEIVNNYRSRMKSILSKNRRVKEVRLEGRRKRLSQFTAMRARSRKEYGATGPQRILGQLQAKRREAGFEWEMEPAPISKIEFQAMLTHADNYWSAQPQLLEHTGHNAQLGLEKLFGMMSAHDRFGKLKPAEMLESGELDALVPIFGSDVVEEIAMQQLKGWNYLKHFIIDILNLPRSVLSSFDFSAPFRQGFMLVGHPKEFFRSMGPMMRAAYSEGNSTTIMRSMQEDPLYPYFRQQGLYIATDSLTQREEAFISKGLFKWFPIGHLWQWSQRAHTTYLNKIRWDIMRNTYDDWVRTGALKEGTEEMNNNVQYLAKFLNHASGRGDLGTVAGFDVNNAAPYLSMAFFSPRLLVSRFQAPIDLFTASNAGAEFARKIIAKDLATATGTAVGIMSLMALAGANINLDPRSADFGKGKWGPTRIDFTAGYSNLISNGYRMATGETLTATGDAIPVYGGRKNHFIRYWRNKLSPQAAMAVDIMRGKNFYGQDMPADTATLRREGLERFIPMAIQEISEAFKEQWHTDKGTAWISAFALIGAGSNSYHTKEDLAEALYGRGYNQLWDFERKTLSEAYQLAGNYQPSKDDVSRAWIRTQQYDEMADAVRRYENELKARKSKNAAERKLANAFFKAKNNYWAQMQLINKEYDSENARKYFVAPSEDISLATGLETYHNLVNEISEQEKEAEVFFENKLWERMEKEVLPTLTPEQRQYLFANINMEMIPSQFMRHTELYEKIKTLSRTAESLAARTAVDISHREQYPEGTPVEGVPERYGFSPEQSEVMQPTAETRYENLQTIATR